MIYSDSQVVDVHQEDYHNLITTHAINCSGDPLLDLVLLHGGVLYLITITIPHTECIDDTFVRHSSGIHELFL